MERTPGGTLESEDDGCRGNGAAELGAVPPLDRIQGPRDEIDSVRSSDVDPVALIAASEGNGAGRRCCIAVRRQMQKALYRCGRTQHTVFELPLAAAASDSTG